MTGHAEPAPDKSNDSSDRFSTQRLTCPTAQAEQHAELAFRMLFCYITQYTNEARSEMANKALFRSTSVTKRPPTTAVNEAGGVAYSLSSKAALAQLVCTGTLGKIFYASADEQLDQVLTLARQCEPMFVAQAAVYARESAHMKDTPALLAAHLTTVGDLTALRKCWVRVMDDGRQLRNFCQIIRSGKVGRKSFGTGPKNLLRQWLTSQTPDRLLQASIGNDPSLADVIKMAHPLPKSKMQSAELAYFIDKVKEEQAEDLPDVIVALERAKRGEASVEDLRRLPFQFLTSLPLSTAQWSEIARGMSWQQLRMNLNALGKHDVLQDREALQYIAARLRDPEMIARARNLMPYSLFTAFEATKANVPHQLSDALQDALEIVLSKVPALDTELAVLVDVSGSMDSPITSDRGKGATTKATCVQVAALITAALLRANPGTRVIPFREGARTDFRPNHRDSLATVTSQIAAMVGGSTNLGSAVDVLNAEGRKLGLVVIVSDNQSWLDSPKTADWGQRGTAGQQGWATLKSRNPKCRLVSIDLQPYSSVQIRETQDVLHVGGFSDAVFDVMSSFLEGGSSAEHWVRTIEQIEL